MERGFPLKQLKVLKTCHFSPSSGKQNWHDNCLAVSLGARFSRFSADEEAF